MKHLPLGGSAFVPKRYRDVIYRNYKWNDFEDKLAQHIINTYFKEKGLIMDVGCGNMRYAEAFNKHGWLTGAIDGDFENKKIPIPSSSFDYIFCKSVIEHIQNTDFFLGELRRILKPGGKVLILTPAWEYNCLDFYNDPTHIKPFHRKGLQDVLLLNNFRNVEVKYFHYIPILWKHPKLLPFIRFMSLFNKLKWKDKEETQHRPFVRFCQEVQLIAIGEK